MPFNFDGEIIFHGIMDIFTGIFLIIVKYYLFTVGTPIVVCLHFSVSEVYKLFIKWYQY